MSPDSWSHASAITSTLRPQNTTLVVKTLCYQVSNKSCWQL